ncbi:unnamed protein product [Mytilus edulis]|uniref:C-type lectin domain-containing protein n=1 Tax=Mytilus edulis TaxID=6550 RepID=A0A8S3R5X1_MYTED|nr:unnamed protein product [Mytilus edulis]
MNISLIDLNFKASKINNMLFNNNSTTCDLYLEGSRCPSDIDGFMHYRHLDLCYNFNPEHYIDYLGHIQPTCESYGGELLRIDSQEHQAYIEHILEGRTTIRVAIQGHLHNPSFAWTLDDGSPLPFTPCRHTKGCVLHSKTFKYSVPEQVQDGWKFYLLVVQGSRCPSDINGFMHYRHLDLCYNFNPEHFIDYPGHIQLTCSSYGGELLRIDSPERQTYIKHILEGRTTIRVAIQGHSYNPSFAWTLDDGAPLPFTPWCSGAPLIGQFYLQIFQDDCWTEQDDFNLNKNNIFLCERRP